MREHGDFRIEVRERILYSWIVGAWNLETCSNYVSEVLEYGARLSGGSWAMINDLREWEFSGLELREPIIRMAGRLDDLGRTHSAFLCERYEDLTHFIIDTSMGVGSGRVRPAYFQDLDQALEWLAIAGFAVDSIRKIDAESVPRPSP